MNKTGRTIYKKTEQPANHKYDGDDIQNVSHDDDDFKMKNIQQEVEKICQFLLLLKSQKRIGKNFV